MAGPLAALDPRSMVTRPAVLGGVALNQQRAKIVTVDATGKPLPLTDKRRVELEFQFNPAELGITKKINWNAGKAAPARNAPDLEFGGGDAATFDLKLVFDTSQETQATERDVRKYTQELLRLVLAEGPVEKRKDPPRVKFQWGKLILFLAVVTQVSVTYTLFDADGTPVRANATVNFTQFDESDDVRKRQNPTTRTEARKTRRVQAGDRLDLIAYEEYGDPAHWRHLAEVNGLLDPRALQPGQILAIPPLP
jgi:nucleoid-associated protein YgaU